MKVLFCFLMAMHAIVSSPQAVKKPAPFVLNSPQQMQVEVVDAIKDTLPLGNLESSVKYLNYFVRTGELKDIERFYLNPPRKYPDTLRAKFLVTYNGKSMSIAHSMDGFLIRYGKYGQEHAYLDDRKQPLKNIKVWIAQTYDIK